MAVSNRSDRVANAFARTTGWLAIAANTIALGLYVPGIGVYISVFSVLFLEIGYLLLARRLLSQL